MQWPHKQHKYHYLFSRRTPSKMEYCTTALSRLEDKTLHSIISGQEFSDRLGACSIFERQSELQAAPIFQPQMANV